MKIRTNSPTILDLVIRLLTQNGIAVKKLIGNEIQVTTEIQEGELRALLQSLLDEAKFDFADDFVYVAGNSVWSFDTIMKEIKNIKKADSTSGISGYFYKFMHMHFEVAQNNMREWMVEYPSFEKLVALLNSPQTVPEWKTDVIKILSEIKTKKNVSHN